MLPTGATSGHTDSPASEFVARSRPTCRCCRTDRDDPQSRGVRVVRRALLLHVATEEGVEDEAVSRAVDEHLFRGRSGRDGRLDERPRGVNLPLLADPLLDLRSLRCARAVARA